jgi:signal transduction histidine kinase
MVRPTGQIRTFRPHRQRKPKDTKDRYRLSIRPMVEDETMDGTATLEPEDSPTDDLIDRASLCLPNYAQDAILHGGDEGFKDVIRQYCPVSQSNATERLVALKAKLRVASTYDFWGLLMEEMCDIMGAQCAYVAKRILVDDQDSAVEMPELGQPGSCLMGVALYINNGTDVKHLHRDYRYHAYGSPCEHMRHDKVFIVPERLSEFCPNNPNQFPWEKSEAFIGVPLFIEGKCFAHFGMIWSSEGASRRNLSWNFIEMFLHSLEDMILQRITEGRGFAKDVAPMDSTTAKIIPLSAITASQSLKPYARSLSHELRTPMQGVVGMLDIMYSTVLDAIADQQSEREMQVFVDLKNHIEIVQGKSGATRRYHHEANNPPESSKRAVEAADNVVHAYDLNMQMPEAPLTPADSITAQSSQAERSAGLISPTSKKHSRTQDSDFGPPLKRMLTTAEDDAVQKYFTETPMQASVEIANSAVTESITPMPCISELDVDDSMSQSKSSPSISPPLLNSNHSRIVTRDFMRRIVAETLRGGHPTSEHHTETNMGEVIEVKSLGSRGESQDRIIYLHIDADVPEVVAIEEQHLQFSLQKVIDNAIKFTESGSITITMRLSRSLQTVEISVVDTGCGIAEKSQPSLFRPHFQEDASRSRARDGLGLSLFNAKAHVRRNLGGDVTLERSATEGPSRGSEFLIRLPITPGEGGLTPRVGTPTPAGQHSKPGAWHESTASTGYFQSEAATVPPSSPARQQSPSRQVKGSSFNSQLAKEYPLNILIAEDNNINRNVAIGSLNKLGYTTNNITLAYDGLEAVRKYEESLANPINQQFDAILMDIWMPNMDGYEATSKILEMANDRGIKSTIIAVTADITGECVEKAKEVGMQGFLAKPYKVLDMENLILSHFAKT